MKSERLNSLLSIAVIFVFITSLFNTVNVLADDSTPPAPTETPVIEVTPTDIPTTTEAPPVIEISTQEPVVQEDVNVGEILAQVPEGTDFVILNENGEPQPLSTQEAADILVIGDPQWCMEGYTPADDLTGGTYCTAKFSAFNGVGGLIEELTNGSGIDVGNGTIYVSYDYDATVAGDTGGIFFDYTANGLNNLVFQGGWDFSSNTVIGTTTFDSTQLWFDGWNDSLTIQDIFITNANGSSFTDCAYGGTNAPDTGLVVTCGNGSVNLNNVTSNNNADSGAYVEGFDNVTITNSQFNDNGQSSEGRGLIAHSGSNITLANVIANGNGGGGAELINCFFDFFGSDTCLNPNPATITMTGTNVFNNNGYNPPQFLGSGPYASVGLWVGANGGATLEGITAQGNSVGDIGGGAFVFTQTGDLSIANSNFSNNCNTDCGLGFGLFAIDLANNISLDGVTANGNGDVVNNNMGIGTLAIALTGNIAISNSEFNSNCPSCEGLGLLVLGSSNVSLNQVAANGNGGVGAELLGGGNVTVLNSAFDNNCPLGGCGLGGVFVDTDGSIYFDHVSASGNDGPGAYLYSSTEDIEIYCSTFSNNSDYGIVVELGSGQVMTLGGADFSSNGLGGIDYSSFDGTQIVKSVDCEKKVVLISGRPINIVDVTSGQSVGLDCENFGGTKLILPNGNSLYLPCPIGDFASLIDTPVSELPNPLPEGNAFKSAVTTSVTEKDELLTKLIKYSTVSFMIPEGSDISKLAILFWDGTQWINVENTSVREGTYFEAFVNYTGTFVLVQK